MSTQKLTKKYLLENHKNLDITDSEGRPYTKRDIEALPEDYDFNSLIIETKQTKPSAGTARHVVEGMLEGAQVPLRVVHGLINPEGEKEFREKKLKSKREAGIHMEDPAYQGGKIGMEVASSVVPFASLASKAAQALKLGKIAKTGAKVAGTALEYAIPTAQAMKGETQDSIAPGVALILSQMVANKIPAGLAKLPSKSQKAFAEKLVETKALAKGQDLSSSEIRQMALDSLRKSSKELNVAKEQFLKNADLGARVITPQDEELFRQLAGHAAGQRNLARRSEQVAQQYKRAADAGASKGKIDKAKLKIAEFTAPESLSKEKKLMLNALKRLMFGAEAQVLGEE